MVVIDDGAPPNGAAESAADAFYAAVDDLKSSPVPAVVLEVPTERIVAASPSGALVLDPDGGPVIGHDFEDFTTDGPTGVFDLLAAGRLTGYEAPRLLRRTGQQGLPVSVWLHKFGDQPSSRFALAVFSVPGSITDQEPLPDDAEPVVIGTTDTAMRIERISNDTGALFGLTQAALLGHPLMDVVVANDQADVVEAITAAATRNRAVTLYTYMAAPGEGEGTVPAKAYQLVILPTEPAPSCAFTFLRVRDADGLLPKTGHGLSGLFVRLRRGSQVAGLAHHLSSLSDIDVPGLAELTTREWEIVARLLDGDQLPAISAALFLNQSSMLSHLSLVFAKLNVSSQQELLDLLRGDHDLGG